MNFKLVCKVVGYVLLVESASMLLPLFVALLYQESPIPFLLAILITGIVGFFLSRLNTSSRFFAREGFCAVAILWLATGVFGSLPYLFCGQFATPIDCFFETCSGFTTTGATIVTDIEALPNGILFWRSLTHWLGGMGVLVLATALIPFLGIRTKYMAMAESPGPVFSKLVPKQSQTSKILYGIYCGMTLAEVFILRLAGMPWFDSVIHALSSAGTGGFSNRNASVAAYNSPLIEWILAIFVLLFSVNFSIYFLLLKRQFRDILKSDELRFFLWIVGGSTLLIAVFNLSIYPNPWVSLRHAFFNVASIISTTGFGSVDYVLWPQISQMILVLIMFCGACAGSTGGGIKCSRVLILLRAIRREVRQIAHPNSVEVVRLDGKPLPERSIHSILVFVGAYLVLLLIGTCLISLDNYSFAVSFSSVLTCLSNVGPGLEQLGPTGNCSIFSQFSKLILSLFMIIGRLELIPMFVLFSPNAWRKG